VRVAMAGARVVLDRSTSQPGPFAKVPNGSDIMSPGNRANPFRTGPDGLFGWNVFPGFYRITASRRGCEAGPGRRDARSRVLAVPPAALGLKLVLRCPHLHRYAIHTTLSVRHGAGRLVLTARVKAPHGRAPTGIVTFFAGRRLLAPAQFDRNGVATIVVAITGRRALSARYSGDGYDAPSNGKS